MFAGADEVGMQLLHFQIMQFDKAVSRLADGLNGDYRALSVQQQFTRPQGLSGNPRLAADGIPHMIRGARHCLATEGNVDDSEALVLYGAENCAATSQPCVTKWPGKR